MHNQEWLRGFVQKRTEETWNSLKKPYYLSFVATDLAKEGVNYHSIIAPLRLRQWAAMESIPGIRTVSHPVHKAKFGFVPEGSEFSFDEMIVPPREIEASDKSLQVRPGKRRGRVVLIDFLEALSKFSPEEIASVQIPVNVLVRFIGE